MSPPARYTNPLLRYANSAGIVGAAGAITALVLGATVPMPAWVWTVPFLLAMGLVGIWAPSPHYRPLVAHEFKKWNDARQAATTISDDIPEEVRQYQAAREHHAEWKRLNQTAFEAAILTGLLFALIIAPPIGIIAQLY